MTALTEAKNLVKLNGSPLPCSIPLAQKTGTTIYPGALLAVATDGYCRPARTSTTDTVVGYALKNPCSATGIYTSTVAGDSIVEAAAGVIKLENSAAADAIAITELWDFVYVVDDQTVAKTDGTGTRIKAGRCVGVDTGGVYVLVGLMQTAGDAVTLTGSETLTNKTLTTPTIADATNIAAIAGYKGTIEIQLTSFLDEDGDPLAKFIDAGTPTFGFNLADSEALCLRWNNDATPGTALSYFTVPADCDITADINLYFMCSKTGATVGDATTITVTAFNQVNGALHDADSDFGGVSDALVGNAIAKTVDVLTLALAAADLPAAGSKVTMTVTPTAGLLGTDDLLIHRIWGEYTKQVS